MTRIVQYTQNGDIDRLGIAEIVTPEPGAGQLRIRVRYAGLNPVDWKILSGSFGPVRGASGNGTDFAGVVDLVGAGVDGFAPGDLDWLARAIARGAIQALIARIFALDEVHEADRFLREAHPVGKVVLAVGEAPLVDEDLAALLG